MTLREFNALAADEASAIAATWADVPAWVRDIVDARPYASPDDVVSRAERSAIAWGSTELEQALVRHARIGERPTGESTDARASRREQAAMTDADAGITARITAGNAAYEERFGRVFLIRAAGRSPEQIASELDRRLRNDGETEIREACAELAQIATRRIRETVA
ncbi:2-oxo-4-hydroxy-4-carboxy-5-ureidoimidazoline decarboxylase [Microbacterium gubbeenense]|uniref:2-oxo-4-hydroxy-4-carboxy-5-ureidoimidazoline decarboxylase n=1 Tax=Microbacterium gubbeenense TaxID=159896 RepID=UPI003F982B75